MKKGFTFIFTLLILATAMQVSAYEFCEDGEVGEDNLRIISIDDMLADNSQEWQWKANQEIELEIRVENREDENNDYIVEIVFVEDGDEVEITSDSLIEEFSLDSEERKSVSIEFEIDEDFDLGEYELYIKFYKENEEDSECVENNEETIETTEVNLCSNGNVDEDDLEIERIEDKDKEESGDWEWTPGDEISIEVEIANNGYTSRDFIVELIMLDEDGDKVDFAKDSDDIEEEVSIDENEDEKVFMNFDLSGTVKEGDYELYAIVYDDSDEDICTSLMAERKNNAVSIEVNRVENNVIITNVSGPKDLSAGEDVRYTVIISNTGNEDEEKVNAIAYNKVLGLEERIEINSLDSGEEKEVTFSFTVPNETKNERIKIIFSTEFEYDSRLDIYRKSSDEDDDINYYVDTVKVANTAPIESPKADIKETENKSNSSASITGAAVGTNKESKNNLWVILTCAFAVGCAFFLVMQFAKSRKYRARYRPAMQ